MSANLSSHAYKPRSSSANASNPTWIWSHVLRILPKITYTMAHKHFDYASYWTLRSSIKHRTSGVGFHEWNPMKRTGCSITTALLKVKAKLAKSLECALQTEQFISLWGISASKWTTILHANCLYNGSSIKAILPSRSLLWYQNTMFNPNLDDLGRAWF